MQAVYDLAKYPANFNFLEFLVAAKTLGAKHILFDDLNGYRPKFSKSDTLARVESILKPACALAGCTYDFGRDKGLDPGYHMSAVLKLYKQVGRIEKLKSVLPPKDVKYTVTLRNTKRYEYRNSGPDWRRFAEEMGAFVIEDFGDNPVSLHERMALYAGAKMNFFVANGPVTLCLLSDYPYMAFMKNVNDAYHAEQGWERGSQLPWRVKDQHLIWTGDEYENIRRHADAWQAGTL
jgi:hypothetical protein